jgi:hypothetical protein
MENELEKLVSDIYDVCEQYTAADVPGPVRGDPPDIRTFCTNWEECKAELVRLLHEWQARQNITPNGISNSPLGLDLPMIEW